MDEPEVIGEERRSEPVDERRRHTQEAEQRVHDTYQELGRVGEKEGEQVYAEEVARGELSRGEREIAHGEFGAAADEIQRTPGHASPD